MTLNDQKAITAIRILSAEAINKAKSGHPGTPIGAAPAAYAVWKAMKHNPADPKWPARDRFVLSCGHASMLEYSLLHLFGYGVSMEDIKAFRQWGSITPGHPEYGITPGVEASTGPLGQGFGMAVGMAMAEAHQAAVYNKEGFPVVDNYTFVLMGDGCMMEGAVSEAASLAGNLKLGKLIALYDSNRITIEGNTDITFTEDVGAKFAAMGWDVADVADGEDADAVTAAIEKAKQVTDKPSLIIFHTLIARGTPVEGMSKAHGEPLGEENLQAMKANYGWTCEPFTVPQEVYDYMKQITAAMAEPEDAWKKMFAAYGEKYPELAARWEKEQKGELPDLCADEAFSAFEGKAATRACSGEILNRLNARIANLFGGSADLGPSNKTVLKGEEYFSCEHREGKNIHYGVRELAMACCANGIALYGGLHTYIATFFVFSDYVKPALRLAALMDLPVMYVLTHDSIGVGEDGPTHQPIEQLAALRATPNTLVFRPADGHETAAGYIAALQAKCPTVLALSRQNLPTYEKTGLDALKGAYILREPKGKPDVILMASGSEVELACKAADILAVQGMTARIVSVPCMELFEAQDDAYKKSIFPDDITARVAIEAGATQPWYRYVGFAGTVIGRDAFGASAPQPVLNEQFGFTAEHVAAEAVKVIGK